LFAWFVPLKVKVPAVPVMFTSDALPEFADKVDDPTCRLPPACPTVPPVCPIPPVALDELVNLIDGGSISSKQGKEVFAEMFATGKPAGHIVEEKGLKQESDTGAIEALCLQAIEASPKAVAEYKSGKLQAINAIKGQVMKLSQGKANPVVAGQILEKLLSS